MRKMTLQKDLLELSKQVDDFFNFNTLGEIHSSLELSDDFELPYQFSCEALHPGTYKGFTLPETEIIMAQNTIFEQTDNYANNEINKDHKNNRKEGSSVDDLVGKVTGASYDYSKKAYILKGEVYDETTARKIHNKILKYVSLRINPGRVEHMGMEKIARQLKFEELSFVRAPGDPNAKILN